MRAAESRARLALAAGVLLLFALPAAATEGGPGSPLRVCADPNNGDRELRASLNEVIDTHSTEIQSILRRYGVPLLPIDSAPANRENSK